MRNLYIALVLLALAPAARAYDFDKCFKRQTELALYRKYDYKYAGPWWITCRTSGKESSFAVSSESSTEHSTMSLDPGVSTGDMTSSSQFSSSWGECAAWGKTKKQRERESFVAQNLDDLKRDVAFGRGETLDALAYYSDCDGGAQWRFAAALQDGYADLAGRAGDFTVMVDSVIRRDAVLRAHCAVGG